MRLLIDQGNTRLKACVFDGELHLLKSVASVEDLKLWLHDNANAVNVVAWASVASDEKNRKLEQAMIDVVHSDKIMRVAYDNTILASSYLDPARLGIDRWLALLAVKCHRNAVVVDAGTAFTVDVLRDSRHQGGYILPGIKLQRESLSKRTAAVRFGDEKLTSINLGLDTSSCVGHGSVRALSALANAVVTDLSEHVGSTVPLFITGGDAQYIAPFIKAELRPLLVFEGLLQASNV